MTRIHKKKIYTLFAICITLSLLSYTKVYASVEEGVAGVGVILDKIKTLECWTTENVNFRVEQNINSNIICTINKRTKVQKHFDYNGWTMITYDGKLGYVKSEYLRDTKLFTSDKNRWGIELTDEEIELLAKIVWVECRGEIDSGKYAVIEIILNRMYSLAYPDTLYEVLSQEGHFTSWKLRNDANPKEDIYECIEEVLRNETNELSMDYIYFSTSPRNNNGTKKIGNHYFCKED